MTIDTQQYNLLRVEQEARIFLWSMSGQASIHTKECGHYFQFVKIVLIIIKIKWAVVNFFCVIYSPNLMKLKESTNKG